MLLPSPVQTFTFSQKGLHLLWLHVPSKRLCPLEPSFLRDHLNINSTLPPGTLSPSPLPPFTACQVSGVVFFLLRFDPSIPYTYLTSSQIFPSALWMPCVRSCLRSYLATPFHFLSVGDHAPQSAVPADTAAALEAGPVLRPLYMDVQATTPLDPRVLDAMLPYLVNYYGNPHSRTHAYGWESEAAMERARQQVASLIGADPREIIFTSGATESNNIAIKELEAAIQPDTSLVSVMTVNNEIGVKQPIAEIGRICSSRKVYFHTDAAQAVGKIPLDVNDMKIDLMSISGHKIYGPKGVGAIYIRRRPRVRVEALQSGGGQERGMRSGTVPTPLVVGLGAACEVAQQEMEYDHKRISKLAERLIQNIMKSLPDVVMNGDPEHHYPGCINLSFAYVEGESLLMALKDVALSSGSACTSASLEPSYVLRAIGTDEDLAHSSIRFGIGRFTTEEEVDYTVEKCIQHVKRLREMSPLWEMVQDGIDLKSIKWTQH
ncbi:cysteine desulfurase isoform X2 [Hylobates moloch]|uniref:cysteine desulfurase isoform X2 n=1 Tax=Hylobates moloch TaxID=81572 RepID=UPI00267516BA|nr:cysteine desulfurase isoform X2 [Hylobates moloch]